MANSCSRTVPGSACAHGAAPDTTPMGLRAPGVFVLAATLTGCGRTAGGGSRLVDIRTVDPGIRLDIRYATPNNFTGQRVYDEARCFLAPEAARRLSEVQRELGSQGLGLKVFDCYRPLSVQRKFWALVPDERYVADPAKGSRHNRGAAVDLTVVRRDGTELAMPTGFDDFTVRAHRDYMDLPEPVLQNRALLERVMVNHGFEPMPTEWWHFDLRGWEKYPVLDLPFSQLGR
jgi:D-alanyl-D-alanine dipeptidase